MSLQKTLDERKKEVIALLDKTLDARPDSVVDFLADSLADT